MSEQQYIERYWRDATPQDAIREPPMVARFRNGQSYDWFIEPLMGIRRDSNYPWYSTNLGSHKQCQVYDAPDPGEGWRLIDVDTETPMIGDEVHDKWQNRWIIRSHDKPYDKELVYRRRIEQPKPEPRYEPFRWEDRGQLRGRWITWKHEDGTPIETPVTYLVKKESGELLINSRNSKWFLQNASFLDTGEPVGRKVE